MKYSWLLIVMFSVLAFGQDKPQQKYQMCGKVDGVEMPCGYANCCDGKYCTHAETPKECRAGVSAEKGIVKGKWQCPTDSKESCYEKIVSEGRPATSSDPKISVVQVTH